MKKFCGNILGLDISLKRTGIAVINKDGKPIHSIASGYSLTKEEQKDFFLVMKRWFFIVKDIKKVIEEHNVKHVFIENYAFNKGFGGEKLGEIHGVIISQIYLNHRIICKNLAIAQWRKYLFMDKKSHNKRDVCDFVNKIFPIEEEIKTDKNKIFLADQRESVGVGIAGHRTLTEPENILLLE